MKKMVIVALLASGLVACAQDPAPKEDSRLKEAYSACINTAEGSPEKIEACQSVLNVLKKEKAHEQFATQENVRVMDYQAVFRRVKPVTIRKWRSVATRFGRKYAVTTEIN